MARVDETRFIGGKEYARVGSIWYERAYDNKYYSVEDYNLIQRIQSEGELPPPGFPVEKDIVTEKSQTVTTSVVPQETTTITDEQVSKFVEQYSGQKIPLVDPYGKGEKYFIEIKSDGTSVVSNATTGSSAKPVTIDKETIREIRQLSVNPIDIGQPVSTNVPDTTAQFDALSSELQSSAFDNLTDAELQDYAAVQRQMLDEFNIANKDAINNGTLTPEQEREWNTLQFDRQALLQQAEKRGLLKDKPQCVKKESDNSITFADTPECEQFLKSILGNNLAALGGEEYATANPCGTTDMDKINVELLKFFKKLKGIKKYANLYINGSLNKITSVTNLVRSTGSIIAAVLKGLVQRFRNYVLYKIKRGIIDVIDKLFPNNVVNIKRNLFQKIIDSILCKFKDIMNGLKDLVVDFLFELIGKIANAPFCVAEQFTNALVNNLASSIDGAIAPVLDQISDVLGGATKFAGQIFEALDFILGFEAFLCARPACPEVNKITSGPWGGPSPSNPNAFERFLASPDLDAGEATRFINDTLNNTLGLGFLDKGVNGESIQAAPGSVTDCSTAPFKCGPPTVEFFGGGGAGAVGAAVVDTAGKILGVDLIFGGSSYTRPPFVTFMDSCGRGNYASGYTKIDNDGRVTEVIMVNNGSGYLNAFDGTTEFDDDPERNTIPFPTEEEEVTDYVVCLKEIEVISTGIGYQPTDEITITPDIPNLKARVKMTEAGQIIAIDILEQSCNLTTVPEITINSLMGGGLEVRPILTFTRIEDFDPLLSSEGSTPQNIVRVIDCVS